MNCAYAQMITAKLQHDGGRYPAKVKQYTNNLLLVCINYDRQTKTHECKIEMWNGE